MALEKELPGLNIRALIGFAKVSALKGQKMSTQEKLEEIASKIEHHFGKYNNLFAEFSTLKTKIFEQNADLEYALDEARCAMDIIIEHEGEESIISGPVVLRYGEVLYLLNRKKEGIAFIRKGWKLVERTTQLRNYVFVEAFVKLC